MGARSSGIISNAPSDGSGLQVGIAPVAQTEQNEESHEVMKRIVLAILAAICLFACPTRKPVTPIPDGGSGGQMSTGGAIATGGSLATGGATATGGLTATGGSSVAIAWPECSKTFKAGPVVRHRLGRRVAPHTMRLVQPWHATGVRVQSVLWAENCVTPGRPPCIPFDQKNLGACTVAAEIGMLCTLPFTFTFTDADIPTWYTWETHNDAFAGAWPPDDTGSDGAAAMQTAIHFGKVRSYTSVSTLADMHALIQTRPGIFGSNWTEDMFSPDRCGQIHPTGLVEGGHEYKYRGFDKENGREWFDNSWGPTYGLNGSFWMLSDDMQTLIDDGGSAEFADVP